MILLLKNNRINENVMTESLISIEKPTSDFSEHLESNDRILFSGAFGIGKMFFLKHFFGIQDMKEKYNVFHLFPVNYQIATNEDIFELIKYDILYHLFGFEWIKIDNEKFSKLLVAQSYLLNNGTSVISKIMKCIPLYNMDNAGKAMETLISIHKNFLEYYNQINKNDVTLLTNFYEQLKQKKGSVHEFDAISEFIYDSLANCNKGIDKEKHKENVLIIDDLDRIDPEHIFRILNIFSAHIDRDNNSNKFGFDRIIFVCDIENIRNIFAAKYGQHTDFSGYIDKFYSSEIFHFNNKVAISEFIKEIMTDEQTGKNQFYPYEIDYIRDILYFFIKQNVINLRQIFANVKDLKNKKQGIGTIGQYYYPGYTIIWICFRILGGQKDALINAFKTTSSLHINIIPRDIASILLPLLVEKVYSDGFYSSPMDSYYKNAIRFTVSSRRGYEVNHRVAEISHTDTTLSYNTLQILITEAIDILDKKGLLY